MHLTREPAILYFGTPVVIVSTVNEDGTANLAPMSSVFFLGWRGMLGLDNRSKTPSNLRRTGECVLNLASAANVEAVDRLALTTGSDPVPDGKTARGYRFEKDKFGFAGLTPYPSETVSAPRVLECPVQLETVVEAVHEVAAGDAALDGRTVAFEIRVQRVHLEESILVDGEPDHVDPDKWRPLLMSFQQFYGLAPARLQESTLGQVPEQMYRSHDVDRARDRSRAQPALGA